MPSVAAVMQVTPETANLIAAAIDNSINPGLPDAVQTQMANMRDSLVDVALGAADAGEGSVLVVRLGVE